MDRCSFKAVSVLASEYCAFDLADYMADRVPETLPDGRRLWDMSAMELALLAVELYPGGALELQYVMEGEW